MRALFRQDPDDDDDDSTPGNPDQPPPAGLCPVPPGPHNWTYGAYTRTCSKCGATEPSH